MKLDTIKKISEKHKVPIKELAGKAEMSEQNLHRCIRANKIQAHSLELIAKALNVPINVFFDESPSSISTTGDNSPAVINGNASVTLNSEQSNPELIVLREKVNSLETLLAEKERMIQFLMERK